MGFIFFSVGRLHDCSRFNIFCTRKGLKFNSQITCCAPFYAETAEKNVHFLISINTSQSNCAIVCISKSASGNNLQTFFSERVIQNKLLNIVVTTHKNIDFGKIRRNNGGFKNKCSETKTHFLKGVQYLHY